MLLLWPVYSLVPQLGQKAALELRAVWQLGHLWCPQEGQNLADLSIAVPQPAQNPPFDDPPLSCLSLSFLSLFIAFFIPLKGFEIVIVTSPLLSTLTK